MNNDDFMFFVASAASVYIVIEAFKKMYPEWVTKPWLVRLMYVVPSILGILGMVAYSVATEEFSPVQAVPYGIVAGALSQTIYEFVDKAIRQRAGKIVGAQEIDLRVIEDEDEDLI